MTPLLALPEVRALAALTSDGRLLFLTRTLRMLAYGALSVVLALYLSALGLSEGSIGLLLALTLAGDAAASLWITAVADRVGRRRMLMLGAALMVLAGVVFALSGNLLLLTLAAIVGTLSPSGNEVGPFLPIEQAALSAETPDHERTAVFAWYNLAGSFASALGALAGGAVAQLLGGPLLGYRAVIIAYAGLGLVLALLFSRLSQAAEVAPAKPRSSFGLHRSRRSVFELSALFALDAFGGGLVVQSLVAYWFAQRYGVNPAVLGAIFFGANLLAGLSALAAARVATRIGLLNTMVFTHLPSNILLMLVPLMPTLPLAIVLLLLRFSISQMDVPTRQSYIMAVVDPDERSAAAGITGVARSAGTALAPLLSGVLLAGGLWAWPFLLAGGLKVIYDATLYQRFRQLKPPEEKEQGP